MTQTTETLVARQQEIIAEALAERPNVERNYELEESDWVKFIVHQLSVINLVGLRYGMLSVAALAMLARAWGPGALDADDRIIDEIKAERQRQDQQWGGPQHDDLHSSADWATYIVHQLGRISAVGLYEPMIKIAALAVAAVESHDRRYGLPASLRDEEVTPTQPTGENDRDFHFGVLAALAVVKMFDHETCYREIVNTVDEKKLIAVAESDEGTAEWSGLVKYGYCQAEQECDD